VAYNFVSTQVFLDMIEKDSFIEWAQFGGNYYGTSKQAVKTVAEKGRICVLDIEMEVCVDGDVLNLVCEPRH